MRAFIVGEIDHPPALTTISDCTPGPGELLVRNKACGLNFADLLMIRGKYQDTPTAPFTLGMEAVSYTHLTLPTSDLV